MKPLYEVDPKRRPFRRIIMFILLICIMLYLSFHLLVAQTVNAQIHRNKKWCADNAERLFVEMRIGEIYSAIRKKHQSCARITIPLVIHTNFQYRTGESILIANPNLDIWKKLVCEFERGEEWSITHEWLYLIIRGEGNGQMSFFVVHPLFEFEQVDFLHFSKYFHDFAKQNEEVKGDALTPNSDSIDIEEIINELESQGLLMEKGGTR